MTFLHIGLLILSTPQTLQSYCMRHDGTLRNDRKAELGIANPEIDLGSALTTHKLRTNVSVHVRTAVPHRLVRTRGKKSGAYTPKPPSRTKGNHRHPKGCECLHGK
jgi:hypothetical protein